jgi:hypothetical protein
MLIADAQHDLSRAYVGGGPGVVVSGLVWLMAAGVLYIQGVGAAFAALFFGGMLIFPLSKLVCRFLFRRENESPSNPFGMTVLECTIAMIGGFFAAWLFLASNPALVFPLAAIAVGTHYFAFKTAYGDRLFWLVGTFVTAIGLGDIYLSQIAGSTALLVAVTEIVFGVALTIRAIGASKTLAPTG